MVKAHVAQVNSACTGQFEIGFHVYGKDGIMGALEPGDSSYQPREIFIVAEVLAATRRSLQLLHLQQEWDVFTGVILDSEEQVVTSPWELVASLRLNLALAQEFCIVLPSHARRSRYRRCTQP